MKLLIKETCVVKGGAIKVAGETHETGDVPRKEDKEAHDLIASGRAVQASDTVAVAEVKQQLAAAEANKAKEKAKAGKKE